MIALCRYFQLLGVVLCTAKGHFLDVTASADRRMQMGMAAVKKLKKRPTNKPSPRPSHKNSRFPTKVPIVTFSPTLSTTSTTATPSTMRPVVTPTALYTNQPESTSPSSITPSTYVTGQPSVIDTSRNPIKTTKSLVPTNTISITTTTKPINLLASPTGKPITVSSSTSLTPTSRPIVLISPTIHPIAPSNRPISPVAPTGRPISPSLTSKSPTGKPIIPTKKPNTYVPTSRPFVALLSPTSRPNVKAPTVKPLTLALPTSKPTTVATGKPIAPLSPTVKPNMKLPTGKPIIIVSPSYKPYTIISTGKPLIPLSPTAKPVIHTSPTLKPIYVSSSTKPTNAPTIIPIRSVPLLSKYTTPVRLDLIMAAVTTRKLDHSNVFLSQRKELVSLNEGDLISILQTILSIGYKINFPLYEDVSVNLYQVSQGMITNALTVSYQVECQVKFNTTNVNLLPSLREINNSTVASMNDPNYLVFYQFSQDPVLSSVIRTDAKLVDITNSGANTGSTNNGGTNGLHPASTWTFTVIASAVATSAILVLAIIFIMTRRARRAKVETQRYISSSNPSQPHLPYTFTDTDNASDTNSTGTDDAQVIMIPSGSTVCDQSTDFSLSTMACKSDQGYDNLSVMSVTSDIKLGSVMDVSIDSSNVDEAMKRSSSISFSKVWNSDVESNQGDDGEFSKRSPSRSMRSNLDEPDDDGPSLSYLHVYYGKPSFTLELLGSLDRPKNVDDYSQSEVDVVSSSEYMNENQSIRSSLYDDHDSRSEISSVYNN